MADALEADWNARLRDLDALQREHERQHEADRTLLDEPARQRIRALAADFPRIWNDDRTGAVERKRMLGLLIEDVTLLVGDQVDIHVRWRGGRTQSLAVARPRPMSAVRKTPPQVVALIDELLETGTDRQIAARLNELGHRNWRSEPFTVKKVMLVRRAYALRSRFERLRERGMPTGEEVARQLGVSSSTVHQLGRRGILQRHLYGNNHRCLYDVGSRYSGRPPRIIAAQPAEQGAS